MLFLKLLIGSAEFVQLSWFNLAKTCWIIKLFLALLVPLKPLTVLDIDLCTYSTEASENNRLIQISGD